MLAESEQVDRFVAEDPLVEIVARDADEEHADRAGTQEDARRDVDVERTALVGRGGRRGSSRDVTGGDVADERAELERAKDCIEPYVEDLHDGSDEGDRVEHDVQSLSPGGWTMELTKAGSAQEDAQSLSPYQPPSKTCTIKLETTTSSCYRCDHNNQTGPRAEPMCARLRVSSSSPGGFRARNLLKSNLIKTQRGSENVRRDRRFQKGVQKNGPAGGAKWV